MSDDVLKHLQIEPLSDEALELAAGGKSSSGQTCCSCRDCSSGDPGECDSGGIAASNGGG